MSNALTLARPYARAAFTLARQNGRLAGWASLLGISARIAADDRVAALLGNPALDGNAMVELVTPPGDIDPTYRDFLSALAENRRLPLLTEIAGLFESLRAEEEQVVRAKVTSATALDAAELDKIKASLARRFGRNVEVETAIDESLIGGAVIDAGDLVIDGSVRAKLARLQTAMSH